MRRFGKWHAEHMNPRPDERVVRLMGHLREAFDIFEQPMLSPSAPVKPTEPVDDKQLREATILLEQAQQRAAGPDVPMIVKPKAALKLMSISHAAPRAIGSAELRGGRKCDGGSSSRVSAAQHGRSPRRAQQAERVRRIGVLNRESPARHSFTSPVYVGAGFCSPFPLV